METVRADRLERPVDGRHDHVLGAQDAEITLVEYGSYVCPYCHAAHEVIRQLRERFGERMRYVYRHLPLADRHEATQAAELAEYAARGDGDFWEVHQTLMQRGPIFREGELEAIAHELGIPPRESWDPAEARSATMRVREDARSGLHSGARVTPTFYINGRRYEGAWDEASLGEAMLRSLGHRIHAASVDFVRWAPSTGFLLLLMAIVAVVISNTAFGPSFLALWEAPAGFQLGDNAFTLSVVDWVNHGLLSVFFLVVGLEIKRELTVGRLATARAAAFPIAAAFGGMVAPAVIYLSVAPPAFHHVWGVTIATDTAFAVALIVLLGDRVPVDLRVFLTAAVIADDLVAIAVVALFYSGALSPLWLALSVLITGSLVMLNRWHVYRALPYVVLGLLLWVALHEAGLHATLAGVILAVVTPTRPPPKLSALLAQSQAIIDAETRHLGEDVLRTGPSVSALQALDAIHDRMESPASKLLRAVEPWSSYVVLPVFALANAGVVWSPEVFDGRERLVMAIAAALVVGKFTGIFLAARLAVRLGIGTKPPTFTWRQVAGAGALAGIGFTMSLFIAGQALSGADFAAAKIAIFLASLIAGILGTLILWKREEPDFASAAVRPGGSEEAERGSPVETGYDELPSATVESPLATRQAAEP
jgi:Na+:H+ antiporter, NhaA family